MTEDFFDFRNKKNSGKDKNYPKLGKIQVIQLLKGKIKIFWKTSFGESEYQSGEFLPKTFRGSMSKKNSM